MDELYFDLYVFMVGCLFLSVMIVIDRRRLSRIQKEIKFRRESDRNNPIRRLVTTMPHDGGDYEISVPDDPDPAEVTKMPSRWRRLSHILFGR